MRTNEIKFNLQQVNTLLAKVTSQPTESGITQWSNTFYIKQALDILNKISYFNPYTKPFLKFEQLSEGDSFILDGDNAQEFQGAYDNIKNEVEIFLDVTKILVPDENQKTISIKLPNNNFSDFVSILNFFDQEIRVLITQNERGGEFKINNFDHDPLWITLLLSSNAAVKLLGRIAWAGAVVYNKTKETRKYEDYLTTLDLDIVHMEAVNRAQKGLVEKVVSQESDFLLDVYFNENTENPEERLTKIKTTLQILVNYYEMGLEIRPSFYAADEVQALYPNMANLDTIESHITQSKAELAKANAVKDQKVVEAKTEPNETPETQVEETVEVKNEEPAPIIVENEGHNIMANKLSGMYDLKEEETISTDTQETKTFVEEKIEVVSENQDEVISNISTPTAPVSESTPEETTTIEDKSDIFIETKEETITEPFAEVKEEIKPEETPKTESIDDISAILKNIESSTNIDKEPEAESNIDEEVAKMDNKIEELLAEPENKEKDILLEITKPAINGNGDDIISLNEGDLLDKNGFDTQTNDQGELFIKDETSNDSSDSDNNSELDFLNTLKNNDKKKEENKDEKEENDNPFKGFF